MPPEPGDLNDPAIWMEFAKSDLVLARKGRFPEVRLGTLCYHCQQAAEKALKALLLKQGIEFPPTHNLKKLFDLIPTPFSAPPNVMKAALLSDYSLKGRYPLDFLDIRPTEYETAVKLAETVLAWAEKVIQTMDKSSGLNLHESQTVYRTEKKTGASTKTRANKPRSKVKRKNG